MATEKLNITGWDAGWVTGSVANVDEAIADADAALISDGNEGAVVILDVTDSVVEDADTVTAVDVVVRIREGAGSNGNNRIGVELLIGGTPQGARVDSANMTTSFANVSFSSVSWDADWTAAQMDGMQIQLTAVQQGKAESAVWEVDCLDVDIVYTPAPVGPPFPPSFPMPHDQDSTLLRM